MLRLKWKRALVIVVFILLSLRVITWFQYPYIMASGDFRPPFNAEAFTKRALYAWDETDFGMPSIYSPRILDPFTFFVTISQTFGLNLYLSEMIAVFLIYFLSTILTYFFVKLLTGDAIISFVAALFFVSNVYLINDREATAIGFVNMGLAIMPCLMLFTMSIQRQSFRLMAGSGVLFVLTYGGFPNYRTSVICLIMLVLISIFLFLKQTRIAYDKKNSRTALHLSIMTKKTSYYLKLAVLFFGALSLASLWTAAILSTNFEALVGTYSELSAPSFAIGLGMYDVTRLITRWGFYSGAFGMPYIPYAGIYLTTPLIVFLCFFPAVLAFLSLLISRKHKTTVFFSAIALISILLTSGLSFSVYGNRLYLDLLDFFMLKAFREASNWIFFLIISFGILVGCTASALYNKFKNRISQALSIGLIVAILLSSAYPLTTGDVARNWLRPEIKGSYLPSSYAELNNMLSNRYWTVLAGGRNTYVVYNFTEGSLGCGNPYPLIFSKPIVTGAGTEYFQSKNVELINELNRLMLTDQNIAPEGTATASSVEDDRYLPENAIDGKWQTRWSSQTSVPQWLEIDWMKAHRISSITILFESAYATDYAIQTWNGTNWTAQLIIKNNTSTRTSHSFSTPIDTTRLRLYFIKTTTRFPSVSLWELEIYAQTLGVPKFLGVLGIKQVIFEKRIILGNTSNSDNFLNENQNFTLLKDWNDISLYSLPNASERLYAGDSIVGYETIDEMCELAEDSQWDKLQHSVFVNTTSPKTTNKTLVLPTNLTWTQRSPTSYEVFTQSEGPFFMVFLESHDPHWKLYVNGNTVPETDHVKVNAYANGWLIDAAGNLTIRIEYETQNVVNISFAVSIALPALLLVSLSKEDLKKVGHRVRERLGHRIVSISARGRETLDSEKAQCDAIGQSQKNHGACYARIRCC